MPPNSVYVITGANSGIGLGITKTYLSRPGTTVIGIVRSPDAAATLAAETQDAPKGSNSTIHIIEYDFSITDSLDESRHAFTTALAKTLPPTDSGSGSSNSLTHINTLICSAGAVPPMIPTIDTTPAQFRTAFEVNAITPLKVFQTLWPRLLENSMDATGAPPKLVVLTSSVGSIGGMEPVPGGAYGPSKAAVNHVVKSLHEQMGDKALVAVALHPGWVQTRMGHAAAKDWGYAAGPPLTVEESVNGCVDVIDRATREKFSGQFVTQKGEALPW